jgi:hypothetical protein
MTNNIRKGILVSKICEAIDCFELATEIIVVPVGKFETLTLNLCYECAVSKFQTILKKNRYIGQKIILDQPIEDYGHKDYCHSDHVIEGGCF